MANTLQLKLKASRVDNPSATELHPCIKGAAVESILGRGKLQCTKLPNVDYAMQIFRTAVKSHVFLCNGPKTLSRPQIPEIRHTMKN